MSTDSHPLDGLWDLLQDGRAAIGVVGLGYVGMPLARCFARRYRVVGYDRDSEHVAALRNDPDDGDLMVRMGFTLFRLGRLDGAEQAVAKALELTPGKPEWARLLEEIRKARSAAGEQG